MSALRLVVMLLVVSAISALLHGYLWHRLVSLPAWPRAIRGLLGAALSALAVLMPLTLAGPRVLPRGVAGPLGWAGYTWMGVLFLCVVLLLPAELARLASWALERGGDGPSSPERRDLLSRVLAGGVAVGATGLGGLALVNALRQVAVKRVSVPLRGLAEAHHGFKIVQLTDIHVGPTIGRGFIEQLVRTTNALEPDVIAITGDLVDGSVSALAHHVAPLAELRARHGVYFVTGNHEYYSGADAWIAHLESLGLRVLKNERVTLEHDGAPIDLAGVHDFHADQFHHESRVDEAMADRTDERPVILLAHQPASVLEASRHGVTLQLSGHTHGGQIFPFNYLVRLQQPYVAGLHDHEGTALYVSSGTGYWGPPMRLGAPAEVTEVVLALR